MSFFVRMNADSLLRMGRHQKRVFLILSDLIVLTAALWIALGLRLGKFYIPENASVGLMHLVAPVTGVLCLAQFGIYRRVTRYISDNFLSRSAVALSLSIAIWGLLIFLTGIQGVSRGAVVIYLCFACIGVWSSRRLATWLLRPPLHAGDVRSPEVHRSVVVYGAGNAGNQLATALKHTGRYSVVGFVDPTQTLWGQYVNDVRVFKPDRLPSLIERHGVTEVLLALQSGERSARARILRELTKLPVAVRILPDVEELVAGRVTVNDLRTLTATDLLGREVIPPNETLLALTVSGKCVMVTGAGGSIGSELVRQIMCQKPRRVVLFEAAENALYNIDMQVRETLASKVATSGEPSHAPEIVTVLGNVIDRHRLHDVISTNGVQTIYHAAAYKHVPIVESNPYEGFRNNTFGTVTLAETAEELGVERLVLISTDKAVRPTSIMGASKRLAEIGLQYHAARPGQKTIFTMVRFGNVLDSSGSVVQRFRTQIEAGGPVTVTDPEMIRYFMSIPEAASLVMQAASMAAGGEVFLLDMGEPVKIDELARSMIQMMGRQVKDASAPNGDIEIVYTGLRPGEKLYEELLIKPNLALATDHPRVVKSREPMPVINNLKAWLAILYNAVESGDGAKLQAATMLLVDGYSPNEPTAILAVQKDG